MKKRILVNIMAAISLSAATQAVAQEARPVMGHDPANSALHRWQQKPVLERLLLDDMEGDVSAFSHVNDGSVELSRERAHGGEQSLKLTLPLLVVDPDTDYAKGTGSLGFGGIKIGTQDVDWSRYNRVSAWIYAEAPALRDINIDVVAATSADSYRFRPKHSVAIPTGEWVQVVWEIEDVPRETIRELAFHYGMSGRDPGGDEFVFYFDDIELQQVEPDHVRGWEVRPGAFAYSHSGYLPTSPKQALASGLDAEKFLVLGEDGAVAFEGPVEDVESDLGQFQRLDFSELTEPGTYRITAGDVTSRPFPIGEDVWDASVEKVINSFYHLRCGYAVPGVHGVCHKDIWVEHEGERIQGAMGAWHDAGDLTVPGDRCADAAYALLDLYATLRDIEGKERLAELARDEAIWGLKWMLRTSFRNGWRGFGGKLGFYTDNEPDTFDDVYWKASQSPKDFFLYAAVEARAAYLLADSHPELAEQAREMAIEDYGFAIARFRDKNGRFYGSKDISAAGACVMAAMELHTLTGDKQYAEDAALIADRLIGNQVQTVPDGMTDPVVGHYTQNFRRERKIRNFGHQSEDHFVVLPLAMLCERLPNHPDWMKWYEALTLSATYHQAKLTTYTGPYHYVANGVYDAKYWAEVEPQFVEVVDYLKEGTPIGGDYFVRVFTPMVDWHFRGNTGTALTQTKMMSRAGRLIDDDQLDDLVQRQLHWTVGMNPFSSSLMWGEGYDYTPYYTAQSGDIVGALPVGIKAFLKEDQPYWSPTSTWNYKEVWIHPTAMWLWTMADVYRQPADSPLDLQVSAEESGENRRKLTATLRVTEAGTYRFKLHTANLAAEQNEVTVDLEAGVPITLDWQVDVEADDRPWIAVLRSLDHSHVHAQATGW